VDQGSRRVRERREMRILGVTEKWAKIEKPFWTTFRLRRRDKDWQEGEAVQVVYKPRSKQREVLGTAKIIVKELRHFPWTVSEGETITYYEAREDGFENVGTMLYWMLKAHGDRVRKEPLNRLTICWMERSRT
jgi:hypothetical protein